MMQIAKGGEVMEVKYNSYFLYRSHHHHQCRVQSARQLTATRGGTSAVRYTDTATSKKWIPTRVVCLVSTSGMLMKTA